MGPKPRGIPPILKYSITLPFLILSACAGGWRPREPLATGAKPPTAISCADARELVIQKSRGPLIGGYSLIGGAAAAGAAAGYTAAAAAAVSSAAYAEPNYVMPKILGVIAIGLLATGLPMAIWGYNDRTTEPPECLKQAP